MRRSVVVGLVSSGLALAVLGCPSQVPAGGEWQAGKAARTRPSGAQQRLAEAAEYSRRNGGVSMLVMRGGEIVFEDYSAGGAPDKAHRLASGTKSFWGVLAMVAVEDGLFTLDEYVADTVREWRSDPNKSKIKVRQLLDFTSGLDPAIDKLRGQPRAQDKFAAALSLPTYDSPGNSFAYGPSHLSAFGAFLERKLAQSGRKADPVGYLEQRIFEPLGIEAGRWTRDKGGNPVMVSGAHFTARNWARFGELINKGGVWNGRQLVDRRLLDQVFEGSGANPAYGLTLWLNKDAEGSQSFNVADGKNSRGTDGYIYKDGPEDLAMAAGQGKQRMYVIRSLDLVIVRQGESSAAGGGRRGRRARPASRWSDSEFLELVLGDSSGKGGAG